MKKILLLLSMVLWVGCSSTPKDNPDTPDNTEPPVEVITDYKSILTEEGDIPFKLLGKEYNLPVSYQTLVEDGWEAEYTLNETLEPNSFIQDYTLRNSEYVIKVIFYNNTEETIEISDSLIAQIQAENRTWQRDVAVDIVAPLGVTYATTHQEVLDIYGNPTEVSDNAVFSTITYELSPRANVSFKFNLEDNYRFNQSQDEMRWIILTNYKSK